MKGEAVRNVLLDRGTLVLSCSLRQRMGHQRSSTPCDLLVSRSLNHPAGNCQLLQILLLQHAVALVSNQRIRLSFFWSAFLPAYRLA